MALQTFVKINGITNLTDARYCAGMYVDLLGFAFEENADRTMSPTTFKEIAGWVSGVDFVAEFESADSSQVQAILDLCPEINWIEHKNLEVLLAFVEKGINPIYKLTPEEFVQLSPETIYQLHAREFMIHLVDLGANLTTAQAHFIQVWSKAIKIILGTGITTTNVKTQLANLNIFGISMTGGNEIKPGLIDFDELADILEALEVED